MKHNLSFVLIPLLCMVQSALAQDTPKVWTLQECLDYAMEHNISLQQSKNAYLSGIEDTKEAKAALFPSLSASSTQGYANYPSKDAATNNSYTGAYSLDASVTVYSGGRLRTAVKQQKLQNEIDGLSIEESATDIRISIVQTYMQCLYAAEAVLANRSTADASKAQRDRAETMWANGSISKVDFAQLESQWAGDEYSVVAAKASLDNYKLQLKQLLELDINDEIELVSPETDEAQILRLLPSKSEIFTAAMDAMPEIKRGELSIKAADLAVRQAKSGYYPSISVSAGVGTGHISGSGLGAGSMMWNRFNENIGLTLNIPIYSNRQNKTAVNKARLNVANSFLEQADIKKTLLRDVESTYLDAVSAQAQYTSATEKERYARESYELTAEQFRLGVKNTVELITASNTLTAAVQEVLQAKYMALMSMELLEIYQGKYTSDTNE